MLPLQETNYDCALQRGVFETTAAVQVRRRGHSRRLARLRELPTDARLALRAGKVVRSIPSGVDVFRVAGPGWEINVVRNSPTVVT